MINAIDSNLAISNLNNASPISGSLNETNVASTVPSASFEQILTQLSDAMGNNLNNAEQASMQHIAGKTVGMTDVINSVMAAERSLNTAIAIRDKMVQAYTEISRMQI